MTEDTFRKEYLPLEEGQQKRIAVIKSEAEGMLKTIENGTNNNNGREMALAKTKLEEAVMWAVKGITK